MSASQLCFCGFIVTILSLDVFADTTCPNTSGGKYISTVCPESSIGCCPYTYSNNGYGCLYPQVDNPSSMYCCAPGPYSKASTTKPNVMILGDSVSIGYTYDVVSNLSSDALVQHSPWDTRNGGACNTSYGLTCLPIFLKTVQQEVIDWDVIQFNFGLHDLDNSSNGENVYTNQLENITQQLIAYNNGKAKLQYALTTPFMPDYDTGDYVVEDDNKKATDLMNKYNIPIVDLYQRVIDYCGPLPYTTCSICNANPCSYHYTSQGYQWISVYVNDEVRKQLDLD